MGEDVNRRGSESEKKVESGWVESGWVELKTKRVNSRYYFRSIKDSNMKRLAIISFLLLMAAGASAQLVRGNRPYSSINATPGFITINEFTYGYGLGGHMTPYSNSYFGFTSVNGYQVNEMFMIGAGTGLLFYKDGLMVPLYLNMRLRFPMNEFAPYISGSGGMLINTSDVDAGTRMYINPAAGVRYSMNRNLGITLSGGLWIQMGANIGRASFINAKMGIVYKF